VRVRACLQYAQKRCLCAAYCYASALRIRYAVRIRDARKWFFRCYRLFLLELLFAFIDNRCLSLLIFDADAHTFFAMSAYGYRYAPFMPYARAAIFAFHRCCPVTIDVSLYAPIITLPFSFARRGDAAADAFRVDVFCLFRFVSPCHAYAAAIFTLFLSL